MKGILLIGVLSLLLIAGCTFSSGSSKDKVYGFDVGPVWGHMYLVNDHTTAYCFPKEMYSTIQHAYENNESVTVYYQTYLVRGALCTTSDKFDTVVVTRIE